MYEDLLKDVCRREQENGCYDCYIDGISVYNYLKRRYRQLAVKEKGISHDNINGLKSLLLAVGITLKSLWQLAKLSVKKPKSDNFIHAFSRMDSIKGEYVDKFTDPLIDYSSIGDSYIIFQRSWRHPKPRIHNSNVVYSDGIYAMAMFWAIVYGPVFKLIHKNELANLFGTLSKTFPDVSLSRKVVIRTILYSLTITKIYGRLFKKLKVRNALAPSRADFVFIIPAAKKNNVQMLELQHGVTYDETITYSGYRDPMFTPDRFLSFGNMPRNDVYGIDEKNIVNIGWAFNEYIKSIQTEPVVNSVLVVSEPSHNEQLFESMVGLAKEHPDITYYFRPHPLERISAAQQSIIETTSNIKVDNNLCNIWVSLLKYNHVMGVDSTVLYEALSMGKIVGKVFMNGLQPKFLQEEDRKYFDIIDGVEAFNIFVQKTIPEATMRIHSPFNKDILENLLIK